MGNLAVRSVPKQSKLSIPTIPWIVGAEERGFIVGRWLVSIKQAKCRFMNSLSSLVLVFRVKNCWRIKKGFKLIFVPVSVVHIGSKQWQYSLEYQAIV